MLCSSDKARDADEDRSRFTVRDLQNLRRASRHCPLRVIALIDFDSFYAQCESVRLNLPPDRPLAVVQFNHCIAVNYAAKDRGVKRIISPEEAKNQCPDIVLQHVATWREGDSKWAYRDDAKEHMRTDKAALDPYRLQSRTAFELIKSKLPAPPVQKVEKASIDEVFLDLSAQVHGSLISRYPILSPLQNSQPDIKLPLPPSTVLDWDQDALFPGPSDDEAASPDWNDVALSIGAEIVRTLRKDVYAELKYTCSAGIARNKTIAKLAAGHNKPNKQTVVRDRAISDFYSCYQFTKIRGLGGKLGQRVVEAFKTDQTRELLNISAQDMRSKLGADSGSWVYNVIRGNDYADVVERTQLQSMLASKTFVPKATCMEQAEKWLKILAGDLMGRLEEQDATSKHRRPKVVTLYHSIDGRFGPTRSKQMQIPSGAQINANLLFETSRTLLDQVCGEGCAWPCLIISVAVSGFEDGIADNRHIASFLESRDSPKSDTTTEIQNASVTSAKRKREMDQDVLSNSRTAISPLQSWLGKSMEKGHAIRPPASAVTTEESLQENELDPPPGIYSCPKCREEIYAFKVLEHLDWHVALELQDEADVST